MPTSFNTIDQDRLQTMNNKEFIADLTSRTKYNTRETTTMVNATIAAIIAELSEENSVVVPSFGTFEVRKKMERVLINPTTKLRMLVPPKIVVGFKPTSSLKDKANSK